MKRALNLSLAITLSFLISSCAKRVKVDTQNHNSYEFVIPKAFSPNGDGKNDKACFSVKKNDNYIVHEDISIEIYNRWGEKIWETSDVEEYWGGNNSENSSPHPSGTYLVKIEQNGKQIKTGAITLLR